LDHKVEQARTKGSSEDLLAQEPPKKPVPVSSPPPQPVSRKFSEIVPRPLHWLFQRRISLGKVTVFDGDLDLGKSTVLLDIAARVSFCGVMPDGSQGPCGDVIVMSGEDDPEDTIQPRLARIIHTDGWQHCPNRCKTLGRHGFHACRRPKRRSSARGGGPLPVPLRCHRRPALRGGTHQPRASDDHQPPREGDTPQPSMATRAAGRLREPDRGWPRLPSRAPPVFLAPLRLADGLGKR
jgi:AAA domain